MRAWTEHGGRIDTARAQYVEAPQPWLDLSTGINPRAWDGPEAREIDLRGLPLPSALGALEAAAAEAFGARVGVAALPGSETGLRLLGQIGLPAPVRHVAPSYASHALPGSRPIAIDALESEAALGGTIVLANPNNPDGRLLAPAALLAIARTLQANGGWLVVDEAFSETIADASVLPAVREDDAILVLRSFGKFFGLAGVRLGFVAGPNAVLEKLRALLGSWPVSSTAITIGSAAYRDAAWIDATRAGLAHRAQALDAVLARHGLRASGACPLFRLVETDAAAALFERLARAGILVRPFDYAPTWLRFGVPGDAAALDRLDRALGG